MSLKKIAIIAIGSIVLLIVAIYLSLWSHPKHPDTDIVLDKALMETFDFKNIDSVLVEATTMYEGAKYKELMQGEQYREEWATPVKVPVVFLNRIHGGLNVIKEGGGKQTRSLRLKNNKGVVYTLRSVAKDPDPLIPDYAKTLGLENLIVDGVSAQHPYGAMVVAKLAETVNLPHTHPRLVFVPKQERLVKYNATYGNKLYWLEYETEGETNWSAYKNIIALIDTEDLQEQKAEHGHKLAIDVPALVRNRLFDIVIGDWDRHAKQWGWFLQKQGDIYCAIPLACDRDNAFFSVDGLLPSIIASKNVQPRLQSYEEEISYMPGLVYPFDVYFLKSVPKEVFLAEADYITTHLTDTAIRQAFAVWPKEIFDLHGEEIIRTLKARRDNLQAYALKFNEVLQQKKYLKAPLKGSEDAKIPEAMLGCFECL